MGSDAVFILLAPAFCASALAVLMAKPFMHPAQMIGRAADERPALHRHSGRSWLNYTNRLLCRR
jgi:hypothetical protein